MDLPKLHIDREQAKRYLSAGGSTLPVDLENLLDRACQLVESHARPRTRYLIYPLQRQNDVLSLAHGPSLPGKDIADCLSGATECVVMAATLGAEIDALLRRTQLTDLTLAVMMDACASVAIETVCDELEANILSSSSFYGTDRFSPGYGDFPLSFQPTLLTLLDAPRRIGLHVTDQLILLPSKSVTALLGLCPSPSPTPRRGCERCAIASHCQFRKDGMLCDTNH